MGGFVGDVLDTVGGVIDKVASNPVPAVVSAVTGNPAGLFAYMSPSGGQQMYQPYNMVAPQAGTDYSGLLSMVPGLVQGTGGLLQAQTSKEAAQKAADLAIGGGQRAQQMAQFRPIGTTTTFGTSSFQVDPTTGQLTSAGYALSPQAQAIQDALMGATRTGLGDVSALQQLGRGYLATSPEQAAADWMQRQQAVLQPGRDVALSNIRNKLFQTGRGGLSTAQGGQLGAANPELQAYYNALAQQDAQLAAEAQQQGRAATQFGQGLLSSAFEPTIAGLTASKALEALAQQPLGLSTQLAQQQSAANAAAAGLGLRGDLAGAQAYLLPEYQFNPLARALGSLGSSTGLGGISPQTGLGTGLLGGLYNASQGLTFGGNAPSWTTGSDVIPQSTFSGSDGASWMNEWWM